MGSLADLNSYSEEPISFTDLRPANVIFVVPVPEDQLTITTTEYTIPVFRPYDIVEIIQPDVANVTYSVDVSAVSGTVVNWATVPVGSTITDIGGVYTINGIDSLDKWNTVKDPTITIPATFNGSFFYSQSINYTNSQGRQSYEWQVGTYIPQALLESSFNQTVTPLKIKTISQTLTWLFGTVTIAEKFIIVEIDPAQFSTSTAISIIGQIVDSILGNVTSNITYSTNVDYFITGAPQIVSTPTIDESLYEVIITPSDTNAIDTVTLDHGNTTFKHEIANPGIPNQSDDFGGGGLQALSVNETYTLVGLEEFDDSPKNSVGRAYLYNNSNGSLARTIATPDNDEFNRFGASTAISKNFYLIGATGYDFGSQNQTGRAYLYNANTGGLLYAWDHPEATQYNATNNNFGRDVALNDTYSLIGVQVEPRGVFLFNNNTGAYLGKLDPGSSYTNVGLHVEIIGKYGITTGSLTTDTLNRKVFIFDVTDLSLVRVLNKPAGAGTAWAAESLDSSDVWLAVADYGTEKVFVYNVETGALKRTFTVTDLRNFSVTNNTVVIHDGTNIKIYSIITGILLQTIPSVELSLEYVDAAGSYIASNQVFNQDGTLFKNVQVYQVTGGQSYFEYNSTGDIITLLGSKESINSTINNNIRIDPGLNYTNNYQLFYNSLSPEDIAGIQRTQSVNRV